MGKSETGKSPGAESRDRSPRAKGDTSEGGRRPHEADRTGDEPIPPAGKSKGRPKSLAKSRPKDGPEPASRKGAAAEPRTGKGERPAGKKARLPPRKAFLVAATLAGDGEVPSLRVYAAVVRSAEAALAAVRAEIGEEAAVELTGSLSTRMAKTLGLRPDEIRQI